MGGSCLQLLLCWIDVMKTVIFLESVADPSVLLPGSAEIAGRYLTLFKVSGGRNST